MLLHPKPLILINPNAILRALLEGGYGTTAAAPEPEVAER